MKKTFTLLLFALSAGTFTAMAQPVINSTVTYVVGGQLDSYNFDAQGVAAGNAGANQNWNFASIVSTGQSVSEVIPVATSPYAASYPTANLCVKSGNLYAYSLITATEISNLGAYNGQANMPYSNPEKTFKFPFNYQDTFTDTWQSTFTANGMTVNRAGQTTVTYDGYGTLVTPTGTYANAARFKMVQEYHDLIPGMDTIFYNQEGYSWVQDGTRSLFAVNKLTFTTMGISQTSYFGGYTSGGITMSVEEPAAAQSLSIFPNPSNGEVTIESEGLSFVHLMTLDGKVIKGFPISATQTQLSLDLPSGMYLADCVYTDGHRVARRVVVQ